MELELLLLRLRTRLQDLVICILFAAYLLQLSQLVVYLEVGSGYYLKDGIAVVLEVEDIFECLVLGCGVCKAFGGKEPRVFLTASEALNDDPLTIS